MNWILRRKDSKRICGKEIISKTEYIGLGSGKSLLRHNSEDEPNRYIYSIDSGPANLNQDDGEPALCDDFIKILHSDSCDLVFEERNILEDIKDDLIASICIIDIILLPTNKDYP